MVRPPAAGRAPAENARGGIEAVFLLGFPLLIIPLAVYNILAFLFQIEPAQWGQPITTIPIISAIVSPLFRSLPE